MPIAAIDLINAIADGNVDFVRANLVTGTPIPGVDINNLPSLPLSNPNYSHYRNNALFFALSGCRSAQATFDVVMHILAYRDGNGNPFADLNKTTVNGHTILESIIARFNGASLTQGFEKFTLQQMQQLVDAFINSRDNRGNQIFTRYNEGYTSSLTEAILTNDPHTVQLLLDLRNADGEYAIDPNVAVWRGRSPLTVAQTGSIWSHVTHTPGFPNAEIIAMLRARGAQENPVQRPPVRIAIEPVHEQEARVEPRGLSSVSAFNENSQNTHTPEVERTIDLSILQLKKTYETSLKPDFSQVILEINALIDAQAGGRLYSSEQIAHIRRGFSYVCDNPTSLHVQSQLRLPEILILVWIGIHDKSKIPEDFPRGGDKDLFVKTRKTALLDKFLAIATTYPGGRTSCLGGTRNLIVSALDRAHPDVSIAPTSEAVGELGLEQAKRFVLSELVKLPIREQRAILRTWNDPDEDGEEGKTPTTKFKERIKPQLIAELNQKLGTILPANFFTTLNEQYEYFPEPVVHKELSELSKKIRELPDDLCADITTLKEDSKNTAIYREGDQSFEFEYDALKSKAAFALSLHEQLEQLEQLVTKYKISKASGFSKNETKEQGADKLLGFLKGIRNKNNAENTLAELKKVIQDTTHRYFGFRTFQTFFTNPRESELRGYYKQTEVLLSRIVNGSMKPSVPTAVPKK